MASISHWPARTLRAEARQRCGDDHRLMDPYDGGSAASGILGEARFAAGLVKRGESVKNVRKLLRVTRREFIEMMKLSGRVVALESLQRRTRILQEFEKLLRATNGKANHR